MASTKTPSATPANIASARKSRATRSAERNEAAAQKTTTPTPTPAPKAAAPEPQPKIDRGSRMIETWVPTVTMPDGTELRCSHTRYGHETPKSTQSCITRMINEYKAGH